MSAGALLLTKHPIYHDLFSVEDQELIAKADKKTLIVKGLYCPAHFLEDQNFDYFLPEDLSKNEAKAFVAHLKKDQSERCLLEKEMIALYKKHALDKIKAMFIAFKNYQKDNNKEHLKVLEMESHKISGSGLSYGYKSLGDVCRGMDRFLNSAHSDDEIIQYCSSSLRSMLLAYQKIDVSGM